MSTQMMLRTAATAILLATGMGAAQAATSGTIRLQGTVTAACTVSVSDAAQDLNLVDGESGKTVGTVVENCNAGSGYTVTISSANAGKLQSTATGASPVGYSLAYDGQTSSLTSALAVTRSTAQVNKSVDVNVTVPATTNAVAGVYSDTITISIAAR